MSAPPNWKLKSNRNSVYVEAARQAKLLDVPFTIKLDDIVLPEKCPALKIPIELSKPKRHPHTPTAIMLDFARGFVPGNVVVVSYAAAELRGTAEAKDLRALADFIEKEQRK